jgi:hypothetical protein
MKKNLAITLAAGFALATAANAQFDTVHAWGDADPTGSNGTQGGAPDTGTTSTGAASGTFTSDGTTTTITSGGFDFWTANDGGTVVTDSGGAYTTTGDFTASVTHVDVNENNAANWGRSGITARQTQAPGSITFNDAHVMVMRRSNGLGTTGWRDTAGGDTGRDDVTFPQVGLGAVSGPNSNVAHMAIGRSGGDITTAFAADIGGVPGRFVQHATHPSPGGAGAELVVGLGHQAHNEAANSPGTPEPAGGTGGGGGRVNTATFTNWAYSGSYDAATFGPAASPTTWQPNASISVDPVSGAFNGAAFINESGGPATGEVVAWTASATQVVGLQPGLNANVFLQGNPTNSAGALAAVAGTPSFSLNLPNVDWTGNNATSATNPAPYNQGQAGDFVAAATAAGQTFSTTNQENYGVHMTGEIFIPAAADRLPGTDGDINTIAFTDGIDDFTFLSIDGTTVIDDNAWTGYDGSANGGSPISLLDVSGAQFDDGEWVSFEMIAWEGGGGDAGVLYWDQNAAGGFPATNTDPASTDAVVPGANFRSNVLGATLTASGFTELNGFTGLTLGPGDWQVSLSADNTGASAGDSALVTVIPEPSAVSLLALASLGLLRRRRK